MISISAETMKSVFLSSLIITLMILLAVNYVSNRRYKSHKDKINKIMNRK